MQNDFANAFFLIEKGQVAVEVNENVKKILEKGTGVGELALLYNATRSASIKCLVDCEFWAIKRQEFKKLMEELI
jgi:cGMP-dependent protein kinase